MVILVYNIFNTLNNTRARANGGKNMISKDMLVIDILQQGDPDKLAEVLMQSGMHCLHCMLAHNETLEEAAATHGIDVDKLVEQLNAVIAG